MLRIRLNHSARETLQRCERKFQIDRLLEGGASDKEGAPPFSRGHAFGKGVQVYLLTQDMDKAIWSAWLDYWPHLEDPPKITLHRTIHALLGAKRHLDAILEDYEVAIFNGMPAVELGYKLNIDDVYYDVGFIDLVLRHKTTGLYVVFEIKYTGSWHDVKHMYGNSGQAIGYSIILDKIAGQELADYGVLYFICQDKNKEPKEIQYHTLPMQKTLRERLNWFISLGIDVERIKKMRELNTFPMRGQNCIAYNKTCEHFGVCQLTAGDKEKTHIDDPHERKARYQFEFNIDDVIADHLRREL